LTTSSNSVFDYLAADYDQAFSNRAPAQWLRQRVKETVGTFLPDGSRVLDIGCGTGDDAIWMASQDHEVLATDASAAMLKQLRLKLELLPPAIVANVSTVEIDITKEHFVDMLGESHFDFVLSNFGALNCVADLRSFFVRIQKVVRPAGCMALTVMGRFCAWETIGFGLRGKFRAAARRWSGAANFAVNDASQIVRYHSTRSIRLAATPYFSVVSISGIGVFVPSTKFFSCCEKNPRLFRILAALENLLGGIWPFNRSGDHYLMILRRNES
jgi:ubiquinone/menaquinone biosynthesis C-methylase UbiE